MIAGYTSEEFMQFTKTQKKILKLIESGFNRQDLMQALELKLESSLRGHMARIKHTRARIMEKRFAQQASSDARRHKEIRLPELEFPSEEPQQSEEPPPVVETISSSADSPQSFAPYKIPIVDLKECGEVLPTAKQTDQKFGYV